MKNLHLIASFMLITGLYACKKNNSSQTAIKKDTSVSITPKGANWVLDADRSDDFDSFTDSKWSAAPLWYWNGESEDLIYKNANTEVSNGVAKLMVKREDYKGKLYTAGCLKSKFQIGGNTYTEVRARMVKKAANVCAAIWLGDEPVEAKNPNIEIDMQETKEAKTVPHRVASSLLTWPWGKGNTVPGWKQFYISNGLDEDFHLYGLERREGKLRFYLDGVKYWEWDASPTPEFVTQLRPLILSLEGHSGTPVSAELPADFQIDWVHIYNAK
ncbi:hypothetical protein DBR11_08570 [Pedobacter sp. HMWF019]|uniref:glycoside hydrolase family 16 protein n=1 Tax=Pedobacter sp. HMWF019 TaxID=2056856 RepID=UPI000D381116|nr:family 16 glycosylhydrolase [Pedobacter sp. HMWF019]PTT00931.1 hypothetical protein DBR11_08570 [Pedobacter sp. HMWF019]